MIIVSQDKRSVINFEKVKVININKSDLREIGAYFNCDEENSLDNILLGKYKTEERAKEVLQEIILAYKYTQQKYCTIGDLKELIGKFDNNVYEMPLE